MNDADIKTLEAMADFAAKRIVHAIDDFKEALGNLYVISGKLRLELEHIDETIAEDDEG